MKYIIPESLEAACRALASADSFRALAGGTDLAVVIADTLNMPEALVDISALRELNGMDFSQEGLVIRACTRIADIAAAEKLPLCLVQGASSIGSPQIRNLGTIGGNVCNASPCGDTLAPLVCLDAKFVLVSISGKREVPAEEFFLGPKKTVLKGGELLAEIKIDKRHLSGTSSFRMIGKRNGQVISQVNASVWLSLTGSTIEDIRAAVGSVAPVPLRLTATEAYLKGRKRGNIDFTEVGRIINTEIKPISDVRASEEYRRLVTVSLFREVLEEALSSGKGE